MTSRPDAGLGFQQVRFATVYAEHHVIFLVLYGGIYVGGTLIEQLCIGLGGCYIFISFISINGFQDYPSFGVNYRFIL